MSSEHVSTRLKSFEFSVIYSDYSSNISNNKQLLRRHLSVSYLGDGFGVRAAALLVERESVDTRGRADRRGVKFVMQFDRCGAPDVEVFGPVKRNELPSRAASHHDQPSEMVHA